MTEEQLQFLQTFAPAYLAAATDKDYMSFWVRLYREWFERFPEGDSSGDLTDYEGRGTVTSQKHYEAALEQVRRRLNIPQVRILAFLINIYWY